MSKNEFSPSEQERYNRHMILPEVGPEGQLRLKQASVLIVGAGGLGSPAALYLAAAGVGKIGLADFDEVDASNLHRQILHHTQDVGRPKLDSAREKLEGINPHVDVALHSERLTSENALDVMRDYDVVLDGTDNFQTRYLVNDACVILGIPNAYGSIFRFEGQASVFGAAGGPCYRCVYPEPPPPGAVPNCAEAGVLGILPGVVGTIQATEAIKLILNQGNPLVGRLLLYNAMDMSFRELSMNRDPACPVCGDAPTIRELIDYEAFCGVATASQVREITCVELEPKLGEVALIDVREPQEAAAAWIEGAKLIPLGDLPNRLNELEVSADIVVHCRSGKRSAYAALLLMENGFKKVWSLQGGIEAWLNHVHAGQKK